MPTVSKLTLVGAGLTVNPFQGDQFEMPGFSAMVEFACIGEATGLIATIYSGSDLLQQAAPVNQRAAGVPPVYPDDYQITDVIAATERIQVSVSNPTAGGINVRTVAKLTPL
jgi:hypothetical protein